MLCPVCKTILPDNSEKCSNCGLPMPYYLPEEEPKKKVTIKSAIFYVLLCLFLIFIFHAVLFAPMSTEEQQKTVKDSMEKLLTLDSYSYNQCNMLTDKVREYAYGGCTGAELYTTAKSIHAELDEIVASMERIEIASGLPEDVRGEVDDIKANMIESCTARADWAALQVEYDETQNRDLVYEAQQKYVKAEEISKYYVGKISTLYAKLNMSEDLNSFFEGE